MSLVLERFPHAETDPTAAQYNELLSYAHLLESSGARQIAMLESGYLIVLQIFSKKERETHLAEFYHRLPSSTKSRIVENFGEGFLKVKRQTEPRLRQEFINY